MTCLLSQVTHDDDAVNLCFSCFSKNDETCYGQDADKNRMARYVNNA